MNRKGLTELCSVGPFLRGFKREFIRFLYISGVRN